MNLNSHENRQFRKAKLEQTLVQTITRYEEDEDGNIIVDEFGDPVVVEETTKNKVFTVFRYNIASQAQLQKVQYIQNYWNQDSTFTIKTYDGIDPQTTDRIIINDIAYSIDNIYKEYNDSTAGMFNTGGFCTTYIALKGSIII